MGEGDGEGVAQVKSVIIKDQEGKVLFHITDKRGVYEAKIMSELDGKIMVTVVTDNNKRVRLRS